VMQIPVGSGVKVSLKDQPELVTPQETLRGE